MSPIVLKGCFSDPALDVMNFLNEAVLNHPDAISFAPGRPLETLFNVRTHVEGIAHYVADVAHGRSVDTVWRELGQYNRTNGIIGELVAAHLKIDEGIEVGPDAVMITVGAQEAMAVLAAGLFEAGRDILLVSDPTYIGFSGLARLLGIRVEPVASGDAGLEPATVEAAIVDAARRGRVRALYDIPDFNNPLGTTLPLPQRLELLETCRRHGVLIIEDNPYGMFAYDGDRLPTLKALDRDGTVLYIGSFSKTLFPGLRVGYLVADQAMARSGHTLARELSKVKSLLTVNTSPISQAIAAGALLEHGCSLRVIVEPKRARFLRNRNALLAALDRHFEGLEGVVSWNRPHGGLFLTMTLPFAFGAEEVRRCAADYGVVVCPMQFFCLASDRRRQIRLSFSYVEESRIERGVASLGRFVRDTIAAQGDHRASGVSPPITRTI
jgi:(S)-3,5-dihydroxyphenylglycine transaminase